MAPQPTPDAFLAALEQALEHAADPDWLAAHSPLAAPYFIGNQMSAQASALAPVSRGLALQRLLREGTALLPDAQQRLLRLTFFERRDATGVNAIAEQLGWSRAAYYRHRAEAIRELAARINQAILPPLHPEMPRSSAVLGRAEMIGASLAALREARLVCLTGAGGLGKTTLAAALAAAWDASNAAGERSRVFWFTVRPGFNDQLASFVFSLGHFLHGLGVSTTWQQILADQGVANMRYLLGLIRHDIASLAKRPPLLIVDEADLLRRELNEHAQLIDLLEELRGHAPMLLAGQQLLIEPHLHLPLTGLSSEDGLSLLRRHSTVSDADWALIQRWTRGNPALLVLFGVLLSAGESAAEIVRGRSMAPSMELLLDRIWRRLSEPEQLALMAVSVFQAAAPRDAWPEAQDAGAIDRLIKRELIQEAGYGGVTPLPFVREFAYRRIPSNVRPALHLHAARICELRAEHTQAAQHYVAAGEAELAVWVWFNHREHEIQRGFSAAARALFDPIAAGDLQNSEARRALALLRAELHKLVGETEAVEAELRGVTWPAAHPAAIHAHQLRGDALEMRGQLDQALEQYRRGLRTFEDTQQRSAVILHTSIGYIQAHRLQNLEEARQAALYAQVLAENYRGDVEEQSGRYAEARAHYQAALALCEELKDGLAMRATTLTHLGRLAWRTGDADSAIAHLEAAIRHDQQRGYSIGTLYGRVNLSAAYIVAGRYNDALAQTALGMLLAEQTGNAYLIAGLSSNAGEACFYLGRLDEAEQHALRSLGQEEAPMRPYSLTVLGQVQSARGQLSEAERTLRAAIDSAREAQDRFAEAPAWRALAAVQRGQNRPIEARASAQTAVTLFESLELPHEIAATQAVMQSHRQD